MTMIMNIANAALKTRSTKSLACLPGLALWNHFPQSGAIGLVALATALMMLDGSMVVYSNSFQTSREEIRRGNRDVYTLRPGFVDRKSIELKPF